MWPRDEILVHMRNWGIPGMEGEVTFSAEDMAKLVEYSYDLLRLEQERELAKEQDDPEAPSSPASRPSKKRSPSRPKHAARTDLFAGLA